MKKNDRSLTIADALFTMICLITVVVWYLHIPYRIEITSLLALFLIGVFIFMKKGIKAENEFLKSYSQLLENENYFRSAFDYAASGMALISKKGRFLKVNHSLCQMLGLSEDKLLTMSFKKSIHHADFRKALKKIREMMKGDIEVYQSVSRFIDKKGEIVWLDISMSFVRGEDNKPLYFVGQFQPVNAKNKQFDNIVFQDSLTGLSNRNYLDQYVNELLSNTQKSKKLFSIFILDLDSLKSINDSLGHENGDTLLQIVAERLRNSVRSEDLIARIGGDEFAIVIDKVNKVEVIAHIAQKVLSELLKPILINKHEVYITASIGIALYPNDGEDIETLIKNADLALYRAKQNKGNNYQFCLPDITEKAQEKSKQQSELSIAMAKNELQLYYQPCVDSITQQVTCVEALIRWQSDKYGLVMPDTIIPLAEESGLIIPLSEWILRTACRQVKIWQKQNNSNIKLSINISAYQFKNANFINNIMFALRDSEFPPQSLLLEIKEALVMHDNENTIETLTRLKEEGIGIIIDDFGTGFSSFSYLTNYTVDKIKIDQSFINNILLGNSERAIVSAMISMAKKLEIKSVAEGVETQEVYDILCAENCDEIQGFLIAKPLPIELMEAFLISRLSSSAQSKNTLDQPPKM